jgi:hypothetical protein
MTMKKRKDPDTIPSFPRRPDRRLQVRKELLRNLGVTDLTNVAGGANCQATIKPPL